MTAEDFPSAKNAPDGQSKRWIIDRVDYADAYFPLYFGTSGFLEGYIGPELYPYFQETLDRPIADFRARLGALLTREEKPFSQERKMRVEDEPGAEEIARELAICEPFRVAAAEAFKAFSQDQQDPVKREAVRVALAALLDALKRLDVVVKASNALEEEREFEEGVRETTPQILERGINIRTGLHDQYEQAFGGAAIILGGYLEDALRLKHGEQPSLPAEVWLGQLRSFLSFPLKGYEEYLAGSLGQEDFAAIKNEGLLDLHPRAKASRDALEEEIRSFNSKRESWLSSANSNTGDMAWLAELAHSLDALYKIVHKEDPEFFEKVKEVSS